MGLLALDPYDWAIACEVVREAQDIDAKRRKAQAEMIGVFVAKSIAPIVRAMRR